MFENTISEALDALGGALTDHDHQWSDELRELYEKATKKAAQMNDFLYADELSFSWRVNDIRGGQRLLVRVRGEVLPKDGEKIGFIIGSFVGDEDAVTLRDELLKRYPLNGENHD